MIKRVLLILLIVAVFLFPLIVLVFYTFAPGWSYPDLIPKILHTGGLQYVWSQHEKILRSLLTSFVYSLLVILCTFLISIFPASVFARSDFRAKKFLESLALAPALVPAITFSVGIHYLFIKTGISDSLLGVVLVLSIFSYPYMLRSLTSGFLAFGVE